MSPWVQGGLFALAVGVLYLLGVFAVVTGGVIIARVLARHDDMDDAQARVFGAFRPSLGARVVGHIIEVLVAAFDFVLRLLWLVRLLPAPSDPGSGTPIIMLPGYTENAGALSFFALKLNNRGLRPGLVEAAPRADANLVGDRLERRAALGVGHAGVPAAFRAAAALTQPRSTRISASWTALVAAPLRRLSLTTQKASPRPSSMDGSCRTRPT